MTRRPLWRGRTLALLGIVLVALSLRTPVAALSPILDRIGSEIALDAVALALIGAAPPLAFAASGLIAPGIARRLGLEQTVLLAVVAMVLGHVGRAAAPESVTLTVATMLTLLGAGVGNVLLPPVVRRYFSDRVGLVTSLYVTLMSVSTAVPALTAVPVADSAGWRWSLATWFLVAGVALIPWIGVLIERRPSRTAAPSEDLRTGPIEIAAVELSAARTSETATIAPHSDAGASRGGALGIRMLRSPTAWALGLVFGTSSLGAYASFAWLPSLLVDDAGVDAATAGALLALYAIMGFPAGMLVPVLVARFPRSAAPLTALGGVFLVVGYLGLLLAPASAPVVWVASAGLGPLLFPLALVLINLRSAAPATTVALSGFVQTVGYVLGALGPFVVGILHDVSGGWGLPLAFLLGMLVLLLPAGAVLARGRVVDTEL